MDKKKIMNALLVLLPLVAVVLAGMPNAVTVYEVPQGEGAMSCVPVTCSFFTLLEDVPGATCLPYAGICGAVTFGLAVIYMVNKKAFWLKWILGFSFVSMTLSVIPVLLKTGIYLIPNMWIPILLGINCLLVYAMIKKPQKQEEPNPTGERLKKK